MSVPRRYCSQQYRKYLTVKSSVHNNGVRVLWRGMSPTLLACIPAHALYFSIYESTKVYLGGKNTVAGALASLAHDAVMTPLDVVKQRMQLGLYPRPFVALRSILRTEGVRALYSSYFTTILMNMPNAAVLVVTNDWMKSVLNPSGKQNYGAFLVSGFFAGALSGFVTCPLDVIKTRIQTQAGGVSRKYVGFWRTLKLMVKEEGIQSLFMGVSTRVIQQAPSAAVSWTTPEAREKKRLIEDITLTLEDIVGSMKRLNMNMEQLIEVSNDTARIAEVWNNFFTKLQERSQAM
ncbi:hypothetical protein BLSTO_02858 [Blastocystis sp. subtype 1]